MDRQTEMKKSSEAKLIASQGAVIHLLIGDGHPEEGGSIQPKGGETATLFKLLASSI